MYTTGSKKNDRAVDNSYKKIEIDELYWFIERKPRTKTHENVYILTMVTPEPRQIVGIDVAFDKSPERIQELVDSAPPAEKYCTDGYLGYVDIVYPGKHIRNTRDKSDTHNVESVNADLRHYIPVLARRSRCFARKLETLGAIVKVFAEAYNLFGKAKLMHRLSRPSGDLPFSFLDFI